MNDDYIPLEQYRVTPCAIPFMPYIVPIPNEPTWFGCGNAVLEAPDCPADFKDRIERGEVIHIPSMSAFYRKRPWTWGMR